MRAHIPVGVYNVVADFGQARGANTATILPNDPDHARKYGRIVLIRNNILGNPAIFDSVRQRFDAVVVPEQRGHLAIDGSFNRTLWHEIGHYLGVSVTADGRGLGAALAEYADLVEEMKSDLVSLHAAPTLLEIGGIIVAFIAMSNHIRGQHDVHALLIGRRPRPVEIDQAPQP